MELIKKPLYLIIALIAMKYGVMAIAYTIIINGILAFCFNVYPVRKYIGFNFKMHLIDAIQPFIMSIIMGMIVYFIGLVVYNDILCLFTQVAVGGIVYLSLSIVTKNDSFIYLKNMLIKKNRR